MQNTQTKDTKIIPTKIEVGVYWCQDEETGKIYYDLEEMVEEFNQKISELPND